MKSITTKKLGLAALTLFLSTMLVGCEPAGPAEKAGAKLDNAGKDIKDAVDPRGPAEKLGDKVDQATGK